MVLLKAYRLADGGDVVSAWYRHHVRNPAIGAGLDARMDHLKWQPRESWTRPRYDILRKCRGLGEVRWKIGTVQHRALGYFGPERMEFAFLMFCTHAESYDPRNALEIGMQRMDEVRANSALAIRVRDRWSQ
jgi:hypothetical protein